MPRVTLIQRFTAVDNDFIGDRFNPLELGILTYACYFLNCSQAMELEDLAIVVASWAKEEVADVLELLMNAFEVRPTTSQVELFAKESVIKQEKGAANNSQQKKKKKVVGAIPQPKLSVLWMHEAKTRFPTINVEYEYTQMLNWFGGKGIFPSIKQAEEWMQRAVIKAPKSDGSVEPCPKCKGKNRIQKEIRGTMEYVPCPVCTAVR